MLNQEHTLKGVSTPPLGSPDAITPEQVLRHHRSAQERYGDRHCPLRYHTSILNFISMEKEFYRAQIFKIFNYVPKSANFVELLY